MDRRQRIDLDNHITDHYGEDYFEDRTAQPSALPAEFAERVGDPIDYADRVAWSRARDRYRKLERPMPKIEHVLLDYSRHFLVVDGKRGPIEFYPEVAATHPAGYIRFRSDAPARVPAAMRGKTFTVIEVVGDEVKVARDSCTEQLEAIYKQRESESAAFIAQYPEAK